MNLQLIEVALKEFGVKEIVGKEDNPDVLKYFNALGYDGNRLKDETAWCSAFMGYIALMAGYQHSTQLNARSWLSVGDPVDVPQIGDVVVFWRESPSSWKGHVGIYIRENKGWIYVLGGNQNNQVCIQAYPKKRFLGYRRLNKL